MDDDLGVTRLSPTMDNQITTSECGGSACLGILVYKNASSIRDANAFPGQTLLVQKTLRLAGT
jgi:hypothetical protein